MKINEKQMHQLIHFLTLLTSHEHSMLTEDGRKRAQNLLAEIANQQSCELREVE